MAKRTRTLPGPTSARPRPTSRQGRPGIIRTSLYLPEVLYEALRQAAFRERCKIHCARMGRNPATGEAIKIKASKKVAFRAAKDLKMAV